MPAVTFKGVAARLKRTGAKGKTELEKRLKEKSPTPSFPNWMKDKIELLKMAIQSIPPLIYKVIY